MCICMYTTCVYVRNLINIYSLTKLFGHPSYLNWLVLHMTHFDTPVTANSFQHNSKADSMVSVCSNSIVSVCRNYRVIVFSACHVVPQVSSAIQNFLCNSFFLPLQLLVPYPLASLTLKSLNYLCIFIYSRISLSPRSFGKLKLSQLEEEAK